jgi:hypothetical protein
VLPSASAAARVVPPGPNATASTRWLAGSVRVAVIFPVAVSHRYVQAFLEAAAPGYLTGTEWDQLGGEED